jgi:hypothetical protein
MLVTFPHKTQNSLLKDPRARLTAARYEAMAALSRHSTAALFLGALAAAAVLLDVGTVAQPSLHQRTHTFGSYQRNPVAKDLLPVFVTTIKSLQGTYAQDEVVSLGGGTGLRCNPLANHRTDCKLVQAWRKPRRADEAAFTQVFPDPNSGTCEPFAFKLQNNKLRLMVSPMCLSDIYRKFSFNATRRTLAWGGSIGKSYSAKAQALWTNKNEYLMEPGAGLYYDPWAHVSSFCISRSLKLPIVHVSCPSSSPSHHHHHHHHHHRPSFNSMPSLL